MPQVDPLRVISDAAYMTDFFKSQTRDVYNHYLQLMADDFEAKCLSYTPGQKIDDLIYNQGVLAGLKMALMVPENVLLWAKQISGESNQPSKLGQLTLA